MTVDAFADAYATGFKRTVRFLISKGVMGELAEEISQAAWVRGWERLDQLRNELCISMWVNQIAMNLYRRSLHTYRRWQPLTEIAGDCTVNVAAIDLAQLIKGCCASDQALLHRQLEGHTAGEIAQEAGTTETAIRIRLMRARRCARAAA